MMFKMKIEKQLNIKDRTLVLGKPDYDAVPKTVLLGDESFSVIGLSHGVKPPFVSLEIEKTDIDLVGKTLTN